MDTTKQTFTAQLQSSHTCDRIKATRKRIECPSCKFLLAEAEPTTVVRDLLLYCRKCKRPVRVNLNIAKEPLMARVEI